MTPKIHSVGSQQPASAAGQEGGSGVHVHTQGEYGRRPAHPRWPEMTRYMRQGACHAGRGHLLGSRLAMAAEGVYSFCTMGKHKRDAKLSQKSTPLHAAMLSLLEGQRSRQHNMAQGQPTKHGASSESHLATCCSWHHDGAAQSCLGFSSDLARANRAAVHRQLLTLARCCCRWPAQRGPPQHVRNEGASWIPHCTCSLQRRPRAACKQCHSPPAALGAAQHAQPLMIFRRTAV